MPSAQQEQERQLPQPRLEAGVALHRLEVGPVAAPVQPERLQRLRVASLPGRRRLDAPAPLQDGEQDRSWLPSTARLLSRTGQPRGRRPAAAARASTLEEVTEEDGVHLVLRVGQQRLLEAIDVALDIPTMSTGRVTRRG